MVAVEAGQLPATGNVYKNVYVPPINPVAIAALLLLGVNVGVLGPDTFDQVPVDPELPTN